jgi:spore maturation protein SpmA
LALPQRKVFSSQASPSCLLLTRMLNHIWLWMIVLAFAVGGLTGRIPQVTGGAFDAAKSAVMDIALPLTGIMALWLGMMRLAELSGLVQVLAKWLRPVLRRLFPDVPQDHPAMGSMLMNMAANMLGLNNAATPLGLRAMRDLETLNRRPGTATNAMCTFLAINTSSIQLLPITAIGILAVAGSKNPTSIVGTAFLATLCSTAAGIIAVKLLEKLPAYRLEPPDANPAAVPQAGIDESSEANIAPSPAAVSSRGKIILLAYAIVTLATFTAIRFPEFLNESFLPTLRSSLGVAADYQFALPPSEDLGRPVIRTVKAISLLAVPLLLSFFPLYAWLRRVRVYEEFVTGAKEGFDVAVRIIPFLVAILVAVRMFREAGGIDLLSQVLSPLLNLIAFPVDLLPLVLVRPLSGGATTGLFTELVTKFGPDHINSLTAATIFGSTETTFYVIAVYFGAVGIRRTRHAVPAGLIADLTGVIASVIICRLFFA